MMLRKQSNKKNQVSSTCSNESHLTMLIKASIITTGEVKENRLTKIIYMHAEKN